MTAVEFYNSKVIELMKQREQGTIDVLNFRNELDQVFEQSKKMEKRDKFKEYDEGYDLGLNHGRQIHRGGFRGADGPILK